MMNALQIRRRLAAGLCPFCSSRPPTPGRTTCAVCAARRATVERARRAGFTPFSLAVHRAHALIERLALVPKELP